MANNNKFAVIGLGQLGNAIALSLAEQGAEVIAIDSSEQHIQSISDEVAFAVALDATDIKALKAQNLEDVDAAVVSIGEDFESLLLCTVNLQELGVKRIISRASSSTQKEILDKMGIKEVLSPENEVGKVVAERLLNPSILSYLKLPDDYDIVEIKTPKSIADRTLKDIGLREKYKLNLITLKRVTEEEKDGETVKKEKIIGVPTSSTVLYEEDTIIVFGRAHDIQRFTEINQ